MNSNKPRPQPASKPDDLIRSNTVELNEQELGSVSGGHRPQGVHLTNLEQPLKHC